jgi:hypothetical protein
MDTMGGKLGTMIVIVMVIVIVMLPFGTMGLLCCAAIWESYKVLKKNPPGGGGVYMARVDAGPITTLECSLRIAVSLYSRQ